MTYICCNDFAVTTSLRPDEQLVKKAQHVAQFLGVSYIKRGNCSIESLIASTGTKGLIVLAKERLSYISENGELFFHPGISITRINSLKNGKTDRMIEAMGLERGDEILDCTLGLGSDAVVASYFTGSEGRIVGLEVSPVLAFLVKCGLREYKCPSEDIDEAMRRIEVINTDHREYLYKVPPKSYDIVYFDPMFRRPVKKSPSINAVRCVANHDPIEPHVIDRAVKVARKRVVMKERQGSREFDRLGFKFTVGGKNSPIAYGVIDVRG